MRLHELLADLAPGDPPAENPEVTGISHDSRQIRSGDLFVAIVGEQFDGRSFAATAVASGAVAVLGPAPMAEELPVPWVEAPHPRRLLGPLSARLFGQPHEQLKMVGITGTNGKSTVTALAARILDAAGLPAGALGTLGRHFGEINYPPSRTTPEASEVFSTLAEMRASGAEAVAMEVSSHALSLGRVEGLLFDVALFNNLTRDHLDFHGDLESYFAAKRSLFDRLKPGGRSVIFIGDDYGRRLAAALDEPLTFGLEGDVEVRDAKLDLQGIRGTIATPRGDLCFESSLIGRYNLDNLVAAVAVAEALELPHEAIAAGIADQGPIAGRLEPVSAGQPFPALIDYAHTPAALEAALCSIAELTRRRIVVVFGCGGDRDRGKRPIMGQIAGELAHLLVVTSDNPRTENPQSILIEVEDGVKASGNDEYRIVPDRKEAIRRAVTVASSGGPWVVLVAGRGHEAVQIIGDQRIPFSDRDELRQALAEIYGPAPEAAPRSRSLEVTRG